MWYYATWKSLVGFQVGIPKVDETTTLNLAVWPGQTKERKTMESYHALHKVSHLAARVF